MACSAFGHCRILNLTEGTNMTKPKNNPPAPEPAPIAPPIMLAGLALPLATDSFGRVLDAKGRRITIASAHHGISVPDIVRILNQHGRLLDMVRALIPAGVYASQAMQREAGSDTIASAKCMAIVGLATKALRDAGIEVKP